MSDVDVVDPAADAVADRLRFERSQRVLAEHGWQLRVTGTDTFYAWSPRRAIHLQDLADVELLVYDLAKKHGARA